MKDRVSFSVSSKCEINFQVLSMTTYEEAIRMHAGRRPMLSRTIVLEADSDDDDVCDDLEPLSASVQNKIQLSPQTEVSGHQVALTTRQPASINESEKIPDTVDKESDDTEMYGVTTNMEELDDEQCGGDVPIFPSMPQEKQEYVIVRTHDKRVHFNPHHLNKFSMPSLRTELCASMLC